MRKVAICLVLFVCATMAQWATAQAPAAAGGNKQEAVAKLEKISAALQLSPEQKKQLMPILAQEGPKV
jgi:hypothetical protein